MSRARRLTLHRLTTLLVAAAMVYVAALGAHVLLRFQPAVARLVEDGAQAAERFDKFRRRAAQHSKVRARLEPFVRNPGLALRQDSLVAIRRTLTDAVVDNPAGAETLLPLSSSPEFAEAVDRVIVTENRLRTSLLGTMAALELGDRAAALRFFEQCERLDPPLIEAIAIATEQAMAEVARREATLAEVTAETDRVIIIWMLVGAIIFPLSVELLRRRVNAPLVAIDRGLDRLSTGDLEVRLAEDGEDELGRLARQVNRAADSLRQRVESDTAQMRQRALERARRLMDAALDAVVVVDATGAIHEWNPQAAAMFGWEREQMLGANLAGVLFPELGGDHAAAERLRAVLGGDDAQLRQRIRASARRGDGSFVPIELGVAKLEAAEPTEFALFLRDVSGEEAAQQAIIESETRYRATFDQSPLGKLEIDRAGIVTRVNPAMLAILERWGNSAVGRPFYELLDAAGLAEDRQDFEALLSGRMAEVKRDREFRRRDGTSRWLTWIATGVRDAYGQITHVLATVQDVTDRVELERELRHAHKMDAVGQLAGGVAHDFNNILAGIIGYADLLEHEARDNEAVRHEARAIVATAQRGADLAQKLLALARELPTTLVDLDARDVVQEVHAIVRRAFDRAIEVRLDLEDAPVPIRADRTQVSNAVLNLALNARDAMPGGGRLTLRVRQVMLDAMTAARLGNDFRPGRYAAIIVADTGSGMSREVMARIFDPFFTTKAQGKGTGLGLAMVYGMVRAHEGAVDVESVVGVGSTFTIYVPALERIVAEAPSAPAPLVRGRGDVLLADDEVTVREVAARMLRRLGYTVESVSDGSQAVARFRADPDRFAFVLLDGDMPRMHGRDAARAIRQLRPEARIFLATGYLTEASTTGENAGLFTAVLSKPYTLQELSRILSTHLPDHAPVA